MTEQRDKFCCVLTGEPSIEIAHIYPFHSIKDKEQDILGQRHTFWNQLRVFWPKDKITAWEVLLFPKGIHEIGEEEVYNLLVLSRNAHDQWGRGAFALKPISVSDDKMTLEVQFFWQKRQQRTQTPMSLLTMPFSTEDLDRNVRLDNNVSTLFNNHTWKPIKSGDYFKLETDDPRTKPLPSSQLLEIQWFLQRVQGMAGAAVPYDPGWGNEDSDEEVSNLGLDEVMDDSFDDPALPDTLQFHRSSLPSAKASEEDRDRDRVAAREEMF